MTDATTTVDTTDPPAPAGPHALLRGRRDADVWVPVIYHPTGDMLAGGLVEPYPDVLAAGDRLDTLGEVVVAVVRRSAAPDPVDPVDPGGEWQVPPVVDMGDVAFHRLVDRRGCLAMAWRIATGRAVLLDLQPDDRDLIDSLVQVVDDEFAAVVGDARVQHRQRAGRR